MFFLFTKFIFFDRPSQMSSDSGFWLAYLLVMVEGIIYTLWVQLFVFVIYYMYRLHKEIKQDEADNRDRFLDDM